MDMQSIEWSEIDGMPAILTEGGTIQTANGWQTVYGAFASIEDARDTEDADDRTIATLGAGQLTAEQIEMARRNSERLSD